LISPTRFRRIADLQYQSFVDAYGVYGMTRWRTYRVLADTRSFDGSLSRSLDPIQVEQPQAKPRIVSNASVGWCRSRGHGLLSEIQNIVLPAHVYAARTISLGVDCRR
jgi:hypothetical protein